MLSKSLMIAGSAVLMLSALPASAQPNPPITADSGRLASPLDVMAGRVPAIHVFLCRRAPESKTWMPATRAGTTTERLTQFERKSL